MQESIKLKSTIIDTPSPWLLIYLGWLFAVRICHDYLPQLFAVDICHGDLAWLFAVIICCSCLPWVFGAAVCRGNLPPLFAVGICRDYLPWLFSVVICREVFVNVSKSFFVYVSKSCLYGSKPFLDVSETFLFMRFSLLMMFIFVIAMAVMGHRNILFFFLVYCTKTIKNWNSFIKEVQEVL